MRYLALALFFLAGLAWTVPAAADKPSPISAPLPTPTAVTVSKGVWEGTYGQPVEGKGADVSESGLSEGNGGENEDVLTGSGDGNVRGRLRLSVGDSVVLKSVLWPAPVYPKLTFVYPDNSVAQLHEPEFARTHLSVMEGESGSRCLARRTTTVNGRDYEVRGAMQLLLDSPMLQLVHDMGYRPVQLDTCANNVLVAEQWWVVTGRDWSAWVVKPTWRFYERLRTRH